MEASNIGDKVVVITGASSGIGESTAKLLARHGAKVVLKARRINRIDAIVKEISTAGGKAIGFAVDVTKRAEVEALIKEAVDSFGRVDVIVNNAGIMPIASVPDLKVDEWDRQIDVNIKGLLYGVAAALPQMQKQKSGHIVNLASVFGIKVFAPRGDSVLRHEIRCARVDGRTPDGTTFSKHPLHDDLSGCCCFGAPGDQLGKSDQKEFA